MVRYIDPARKLLYHADRLAELRNGKPGAPINVEIDLSNRCSLGCEWCHFAYTHTKGPHAKAKKPQDATPGGDLMDTALAKRVIDELVGAGVRSVVWSGGGEPTLHPDFDEIVEYAGRRIAQGMYTHGGHIDAERGALLRRWMDWVYISLDECNAPDYKRMKGVDGFRKAWEGTKHLLRAEGPATIGVGFLLGPHNFHHVRGMVGMALQELGADYVQFRPIIDYSHEAPGAANGHAGWVWPALSYLVEYEDNPRVIFDADRFRDYRDWQGHGYATCYWAALQTVITPNGKMWVCANKREYPGGEVADLSQMSWAEAWDKAGAVAVDGACRVMCRGHIPNVALQQIMTPGEHWRFV